MPRPQWGNDVGALLSAEEQAVNGATGQSETGATDSVCGSDSFLSRRIVVSADLRVLLLSTTVRSGLCAGLDLHAGGRDAESSQGRRTRNRVRCWGKAMFEPSTTHVHSQFVGIARRPGGVRLARCGVGCRQRTGISSWCGRKGQWGTQGPLDPGARDLEA